MTSTRPYLLRALYAWIVDNNLTPHLLVDAENKQVRVPRQYVENGKIVLNLLPSAVQKLEMGNDWVNFSARFGGSPFAIYIPIHAVLAIYAKETGQGMAFQPEEPAEEPPAPQQPPRPPPRGRPVLKRVK
ncbi:MAG: ClpXP protease specificity-enhancing factor [Gammaproteobacteria bacterium]|nr:ClpXP protease specificity-enhancing factor [Gammaproteobacteria bacterium]